MRLGCPRFGTVVRVSEISDMITRAKRCLAMGSRTHALGKNAHRTCTSEVLQTASIVRHVTVCVPSHSILVGSLPGLAKINQKHASPVPVPAKHRRVLRRVIVLTVACLLSGRKMKTENAKQKGVHCSWELVHSAVTSHDRHLCRPS